MTDHSTHKLDGYLDNRVWVVFCKLCSREGELLAEPCPGEYKPKQVDTNKEPN